MLVLHLLPRPLAVALAIGPIACAVGEIPDDFEFLENPIEYIEQGYRPVDPIRIDVGAPIYTEYDIPLYPSDEVRQSLVKCDDGRPLCAAGSQCFGWVEFSFTLSDEGEAELPILYAACPYPVIVEPFLRTLRTWRFEPNPKFENGGVYTTTILAYPLDVST